MTHVSPLGRRAFAASICSISCLLAVHLYAGQNPIAKIFGGGNTSYRIYRDPAGRFQLEYPTKDWHLLPNVGSSLAVFTHNDGPSLFVDYVKLSAALTPGELEQMADLEVTRIKQQQPSAKDFKSDALETRAGHGVVTHYSRVGSGPESVVDCAIPIGLDLYRLNGVVPLRLSSKFEPIVMHMIQSFKAPADPLATPKN
jgi:hypothetical protein